MYIVTEKKLASNFNILNKKLFNNQLIQPEFIISSIDKGIWAETNDVELEIFQELPHRLFFLNILAHEMVHIWEIAVMKKDAAHGKYFWSWHEKFASIGLELQVSY